MANKEDEFMKELELDLDFDLGFGEEAEEPQADSGENPEAEDNVNDYQNVMICVMNIDVERKSKMQDQIEVGRGTAAMLGLLQAGFVCFVLIKMVGWI